MKKLISLFIVILLFGSISVMIFAASDGPEITFQPQSPNYPEYSVAIYTVKATGTNLSATWYMEWLGDTYMISNLGGAMQPWEPYAGEAYGPRQLDNNTFAFIFEGIEYDLDGASIWCVIEDGHYDVSTQKVRISVGNPNSPPQITDIPSQITVEQGKKAEIRCVAQAPVNTQLSFLWYETDTGRMEDMRAINRGTETSDYIIPDTSSVGTRYYLCRVETSEGGLAYSSIVTVTVTEKTEAPEPPTIQTSILPDGEVKKPYSAKIFCSDPNAEFMIYYNPGGVNDFDKTGLVLGKDGTISGTPETAGSFTFCVCATGAGGENYMVYTLKIKESFTEPTEVPGSNTEPPATETDGTKPVSAPTETKAPQPTSPDADNKTASTDIPLWSLFVIGFLGIGIGLGFAMILIRKK